MTAAMQNITYRLSEVKMTERDTIGVVSKRNHIYRLLTVFQCLLMLPLFGIRKITGVEKETPLAAVMSAHRDTFYRFLDNPDANWRKALWRISLQLCTALSFRF